MITPPSGGMCFMPDQVRLVQMVSVGRTIITANRRQKPSLRRATATSLPPASAASGRHLRIMPDRGGRTNTQATARESFAWSGRCWYPSRNSRSRTAGCGARLPAHPSRTPLLAASPGVPLQPRFGPGSARLHAASGALVLPAAPSLRHDVDTPADLAAAAPLGLGPRTVRLIGVQGTVATFDEATGAGTV